MKIEVLISTMNRLDAGFTESMNIDNCSKVVINQVTVNSVQPVDLNFDRLRFYSFLEKGLSKSRNKAILKSNEDICVIADDDISYVENVDSLIISAYEEYPNADVIIFDYDTDSIERKCNRIGEKGKSLNVGDILKVSSVRITFRRNSILGNNIVFNENFGSGAKFSSGEENLFLKECLEKNLTIIYIPTTICNVDFGESTWFNGYNKQWFVTKGAFAREFFKNYKAHIYILYIAFSKFTLYKKDSSIFKALYCLYLGYFKAA